MSMYTHTFTIGLGFDRDNTPIDPEKARSMIYHARQQLADSFGGWSETRGAGGWKDDTLGYVVEPNVTFTCVADSPAHGPAVAAWLRDLFRQASVMYTCAPTDCQFI